MASGDLNLYVPGSKPTVEVVADADGNVAGRGDLVEIVGESDDGHPQVQLCGTAGAGIGHLKRYPEAYDESETYAQGDVVDDSTVLLRHYVDWFKGDPGALAAGDLVVSATDGGVAAYDSAGGDTPDRLIGPVWRTSAHAEGTASKVAVVRHR